MRLAWNTGKPEEIEEEYLVTTKRGGGKLQLAYWTNKYHFGHTIIGNWHWETGSPYPEDTVVAWLPLPTPYKES